MNSEQIASRLSALRQSLREQNLDGCLVPMADEFQSEYVPASARRIEFLSGFTGSAGLIVVLADKAAFVTDGRYTLQAAQQIPSGLFAIFDSAEKTSSGWLKENVQKGAKIGFDPWLHSANNIERLRKNLTASGIELIATRGNLIDAIWHDRPAPPCAPIIAHDIKYAGKSSAEKRAELAEELKKNEHDTILITDPCSIAWLLNVRGGDVPCAPLPLSYVLLHNDARVEWFVDPRKLRDDLSDHLGAQVTQHSLAEFPVALERLGKAHKKVHLDADSAAAWIADHLQTCGASLAKGDDPCALPKACKNTAELNGMRNAHIRDGVALSRFLAWIDRQQPIEEISELDVEAKLEEFRTAHDLYRGPSFETIAGSGPNGAIVHYRATKQTSRKLETGTFLLVDSGGQYLDGTTDVTRTIAIGNVNAKMRDRFTRVLKGHIALANIRFPFGTTGSELDVLARQYLWTNGLDYGHGTGHGVGCYLSVHEGPQSISRRSYVALKPGMILSNEPGYYEANLYGIRIENLLAVIEIPEISSPARCMLGFETITLAPIDLRAVETNMLLPEERTWLNAYHAKVRTTLMPLMKNDAEHAWLQQATQEI